MTISHDEAYRIATGNRLLAADMFGRLTEVQWQVQSLCTGWTVREVAAHLVPPERGFRKRDFARLLIRYRGSLDQLVEGVTRETAKLPVETLVRQLRDRAGMRLDVPVIGPFGPMADTAIHLRDVARPLGLDVNPEPASWRPVLDFLVTKHARYGFRTADRLDGLRLEATDQDWAWGDGAPVRATSEALALAVTGRAIVVPELSGPGAELLADRITPS